MLGFVCIWSYNFNASCDWIYFVPFRSSGTFSFNWAISLETLVASTASRHQFNVILRPFVGGIFLLLLPFPHISHSCAALNKHWRFLSLHPYHHIIKICDFHCKCIYIAEHQVWTSRRTALAHKRMLARVGGLHSINCKYRSADINGCVLWTSKRWLSNGIRWAYLYTHTNTYKWNEKRGSNEIKKINKREQKKRENLWNHNDLQIYIACVARARRPSIFIERFIFTRKMYCILHEVNSFNIWCKAGTVNSWMYTIHHNINEKISLHERFRNFSAIVKMMVFQATVALLCMYC